jgi:lysine 2-monooxygenase
MRFSRRDVLGGTAALSLWPIVARAGGDAALDVAIVGGGVAGTYTAWRLRNEQPGLRISLFEMSDRIGGRLRSIAFPQAPHLVGEAGGMRYLQSQKHVFNLVKYLNLPVRNYPVFEPRDRLALRGRTFSYAEMGEPTKLYPYNIPPSDQSPKSRRFIEGLEKIVPGADKMTPEKWLSIRSSLRYKGRPLKDWAAWALLADVFSPEEMRFVRDSSGYDSFPLYETALGDFDLDFLGDDESKPFFTIAGGYQKLPLTLADEARRLGAHVEMQTRLASLSTPASPNEPFRIGLRDRNGRMTTIAAKRVVLAMPRRALETIEDFAALRNSRVASLIASVEAVPASKAFLLYPKPWWRDLGIDGGRSVTDAPARMFYPLGAEKDRLKSEPTNGFGLLMMYCCGETVKYWQQLAPAALRSAAGFEWLSGNSQLANEIHREAAATYATNPPQPVAACFQDWTVDPFGGGWHVWGMGKDAAQLSDLIMKPLADRELYICGEAYCRYEGGWVEGAVERAETMLQQYFGLRAPKWLG